MFNPLTPLRDQDRISPYNIKYNINWICDENKENINLRIISRSNAKFSECNCKSCIVDSKEKDKFDLGVKGLNFMLLFCGQLCTILL